MVRNLPQKTVQYYSYNLKTRRIRPILRYKITEKFMNIRKNFIYWYDSTKQFMFFKYSVCTHEKFEFLVNNVDAYEQDN
jgi:hypothetical protein